jgi:hypothetical protein
VLLLMQLVDWKMLLLKGKGWLLLQPMLLWMLPLRVRLLLLKGQLVLLRLLLKEVLVASSSYLGFSQ